VLIKGGTLQDAHILLDGQVYVGSSFIRCQFIYEGADPPAFYRCTFTECEWNFEGAASNTLTYLSMLEETLSPRSRNFISQLFTNLRDVRNREAHGRVIDDGGYRDIDGMGAVAATALLPRGRKVETTLARRPTGEESMPTEEVGLDSVEQSNNPSEPEEAVQIEPKEARPAEELEQ